MATIKENPTVCIGFLMGVKEGGSEVGMLNILLIK
jgi:hypothetical protein